MLSHRFPDPCAVLMASTTSSAPFPDLIVNTKSKAPAPPLTVPVHFPKNACGTAQTATAGVVSPGSPTLELTEPVVLPVESPAD
ncbi:hypothetical protein OHB26_30735 [Nocardia sp. NBC_01503]|uniref:hypothetical protein n=1 Tax=Nocardia sp. NBC_01503 TaxID=2975997 RepID=UPI002E7B0F51|nr:hypothetical protein [Nocardia sp. NBC_01503]WTL31256.1 hypothetical protein OHB26_30735 [Nocardia sp. NBC_01503]